jgi:SAM-dependent methyltransferase
MAAQDEPPQRHGPSQDAAASPSAWVLRFAHLIPAGGPVLDLAAGSGRHSRFFLERGHPVLAVDRDAAALAAIGHPRLTWMQADLEAGAWPLEQRRFAGVVVTNYLHRPLLPRLVEAVANGGALLYETFAEGNEALGRPSNPHFLLRQGELLEAVRGDLAIVAYEHGRIDRPRPAVVQRIAAVRSPAARLICAIDRARADA